VRVTRVMIADDHPIIVSGLESVLRGTDFEIVGVETSGERVLDSVARAKPDILILDISMPGRDGLDILAALRARRDPCRVVMLTAGINDEGLMRTLDLKAEGVLLKEGPPSALVRALEKVRCGVRVIDEALLQRALDLKMGGAPDRSGFAALSPREQAVALQVAEGRRNKEIADALGISEGTVKVHLHKIYDKLGVTNRTELAILTRKNAAP
jgi:two-component system nitrate/nitrite response regulator NarP